MGDPNGSDNKRLLSTSVLNIQNLKRRIFGAFARWSRLTQMAKACFLRCQNDAAGIEEMEDKNEETNLEELN